MSSPIQSYQPNQYPPITSENLENTGNPESPDDLEILALRNYPTFQVKALEDNHHYLHLLSAYHLKLIIQLQMKETYL
ncbi:MAG: hypothetical protein ACPGEF_02940 [Endozoicomonas sp.]